MRDPDKLSRLVDSELPGFLSKSDYQCNAGGAPGLLHCAVLAGNAASTRILLDAGAAIDEQDSLGRSPLMQACSEGNEDVARLLVRAGAALNLLDKDGQNCAHCAFCMEHEELGAWLVAETDVDLSAVDSDGRTPLDWRDLNGSGQESGSDYDGGDDGGDEDDDDGQGHGDASARETKQGEPAAQDDQDWEVGEARLASAKKGKSAIRDDSCNDLGRRLTQHTESNAFIINGEKTSFPAGTGLRATRWLRKSDVGVISCDD